MGDEVTVSERKREIENYIKPETGLSQWSAYFELSRFPALFQKFKYLAGYNRYSSY